MAARKVFLLGQSGAGKSSVGNMLLKNPRAFKEAPIGSMESETTEVAQSRTCFDQLELTVFDTQGMGDSKGRSIKFLDKIMMDIKREKPHGFVFLINGGNGAKFGGEVKIALRCFAQCLKPTVDSDLGLPHGRVLLVVNHLPCDASFGGRRAAQRVSEEEKNVILAKTVDDSNELLTACLNGEQKLPVEHTFGIQSNSDETKENTTIAAIWSAISSLPDEPLDIEQFRTFADVMKEATALRSDAVSAEEFAMRKADQLRYDIGWHRNRIRDCTIAQAATCWIPFVSIATTTGFVAAIADSSNKIPGLEEELEKVNRDKDENLSKAKQKAEEWLTEMTEMKSAMETK